MNYDDVLNTLSNLAKLEGIRFSSLTAFIPDYRLTNPTRMIMPLVDTLIEDDTIHQIALNNSL